MIEQNRTNRAVGFQIIFAGCIISMPCHHIQRAVPDFRSVKLTAPFDHNRRRHLFVLKRGHWRFKIPTIGHAVGPDWSAPGQIKFLTVVFTDKSAAWSVKNLDTVDQAARENGDFFGSYVDYAQLCCKAELALLRHNQQFGVGGIKIFIFHGGADQINMAGHADLSVHIACRGHCSHAGEPC